MSRLTAQEGHDRRERYIELRQGGTSRVDAAAEVGLAMHDKTARQYERWFQARSEGKEIVARAPGEWQHAQRGIKRGPRGGQTSGSESDAAGRAPLS